jgi:hypothetical protein
MNYSSSRGYFGRDVWGIYILGYKSSVGKLVFIDVNPRRRHKASL